MSRQSWYVVTVLLGAVAVSALLLGGPLSFLAVLAAAGYVAFTFGLRPSRAWREELDRTVIGKSPARHVAKASSTTQRRPYVRAILVFIALGAAFFAGAVLQRANDEAEMRQWGLIDRLRNAGLLPDDESNVTAEKGTSVIPSTQPQLSVTRPQKARRMSGIASFHLVRKEDIERLKDLATQPIGPGEGGKWHDPYWEFIFANGRELEEFDWSGDVMLDVVIFLDSRSVDLNEHCENALSDFFCDVRGTTTFIFHAAPARKLAQLIESNLPDQKAMEAFVSSPDMVSPDGEATPAEAVLDGLRILKKWLSQIDEEHVGLWSITN